MEGVSSGDALPIIIQDSIDYSDSFAQVLYSVDSTNGLLYECINRFDFFIAVICCLVICAIVYSIIKTFTRF